MSDGYIRWYESRWSAAIASSRVAQLERYGISLRNPSNRRITILAEECNDDGWQVEVTHDEAINLLSLDQRASTVIQFWFGRDYDTATSFDRPSSGEGVVIDFALDGVGTSERLALVRFILNHLEFTDLLVVDLDGVSDHRAWDALHAGSELGSPPAWPDLYALSDRLVDRWSWSGKPTQRIGPLVACDRSQLLWKLDEAGP
jgi:hypothetical protein